VEETINHSNEEEESAMNITIIGLDIPKNVFQVHGVDANGKVALRKQLKRVQLLAFFANLSPCLIGLEACGGAHYWIDRFEVSRPDATPVGPGLSDARTCSKPAALPWTSITFDAATAACGRSGKRLCTGAEWLAACDGGAGRLYPYGNAYDSTFCNGLDFDGVPGGADDDVLLPPGDPFLSACVSLDGVSDLSGNAREWTNDVRGDTGAPSFTPIAVTRGGGYDTPRAGLACTFDLSRAASTTRLPTLGFRCCSDTAP
jgi:formylglycine-generating enzyme required for sulfatase activity